jgi:hypothetical protein
MPPGGPQSEKALDRRRAGKPTAALRPINPKLIGPGGGGGGFSMLDVVGSVAPMLVSGGGGSFVE